VLDPQRLAQSREVGGVLGGVVGPQVDALSSQTAITPRGGLDMQAPRRRGVVRKADRVRVDLIDPRAGELGLGVELPALVHDDQRPVPVQPGRNQIRYL
jgi:hypothetical protein